MITLSIRLPTNLARRARVSAEDAGLTVAEWVHESVLAFGDRVSAADAVRLQAGIPTDDASTDLRVRCPEQLDAWRQPTGLNRSDFVAVCCLATLHHEASANAEATAPLPDPLDLVTARKIASAAGVSIQDALGAIDRFVDGSNTPDDEKILARWRATVPEGQED